MVYFYDDIICKLCEKAEERRITPKEMKALKKLREWLENDME